MIYSALSLPLIFFLGAISHTSLNLYICVISLFFVFLFLWKKHQCTSFWYCSNEKQNIAHALQLIWLTFSLLCYKSYRWHQTIVYFTILKSSFFQSSLNLLTMQGNLVGHLLLTAWMTLRGFLKKLLKIGQWVFLVAHICFFIIRTLLRHCGLDISAWTLFGHSWTAGLWKYCDTMFPFLSSCD